MSAYSKAYNAAFDAAVDYLVCTARAAKVKEVPDEGDVEFAAKDAVRDVWAALHGFGSPDSPDHDQFWELITDYLAQPVTS